MMVNTRYYILAVVGLLLAAILYFTTTWVIFINTPILASGKNSIYEIKAGMTIQIVSHDLQKQGMIKHPRYLVLLAHLNRQAAQIKKGEYAIKGGMRPKDFLNLIVSGKVVQHSLTLVEGWTFHDIMQALAKDPNIDSQLNFNDADKVMHKIGGGLNLPEGLFFPETYQFPKGTSDIAFLERAYGLLVKQLMPIWALRAADLPYQSPYDAVIVASLIEKETAVTAERPIVASVIINRLAKKMPLQIDPTVIYGLGDDYNGHLNRHDLQRDTPYNTYLHRGLPPTPIAIVSLSSLMAALHPAKTDYLYYVAKGDGAHQFSATLKEHNKAVSAYRRLQQSKITDR